MGPCTKQEISLKQYPKHYSGFNSSFRSEDNPDDKLDGHDWQHVTSMDTIDCISLGEQEIGADSITLINDKAFGVNQLMEPIKIADLSILGSYGPKKYW